MGCLLGGSGLCPVGKEKLGQISAGWGGFTICCSNGGLQTNTDNL